MTKYLTLLSEHDETTGLTQVGIGTIAFGESRLGSRAKRNRSQEGTPIIFSVAAR